ncbi:abortive infection family protein [Mesorhizobium sp. WSM4935]|uniref:abortive infection family protein n=1 Tax=Mesorhizobium sp. WSM4935 TaxID=3038547 RepID=UPI0024155EDD|nr:abortive infection family protein [Mesorhizobium sp. WSM4935]MDG4877504.1 abortive infection family protein [Mesorhizobium sp. WSM4935]
MRIELSEQSIEALAEIISGGAANGYEPPIGLYRQGWRLEAWFKGFGVPFDIKAESRLPATKTAIRGAVFIDNDNGDLLRRIIESSADPRDFISEPERHLAVVDYLNKHLFYDGLKLERAGRTMRLVEIAEAAAATGELSAMAAGIDFDTVGRDLDRALRAVSDDPEIAVTATCAVVESVCRSILVELEIDFPTKQDVSSLYRAVREPLGLDPMKEGLTPEIVNDVKSVLSGLVTAVQSIGSLRTHVGGAHGKEKGFRRIDARIAKLAIHSASAIALFIIETWQIRYPGRKLPLRDESREAS